MLYDYRDERQRVSVSVTDAYSPMGAIAWLGWSAQKSMTSHSITTAPFIKLARGAVELKIARGSPIKTTRVTGVSW